MSFAALMKAGELAAELSRTPGKLIILEVRPECLEVSARYRDTKVRPDQAGAMVQVPWKSLDEASFPERILENAIREADAKVMRFWERGGMDGKVIEVQERANTALKAMSPPFNPAEMERIIGEHVPEGWAWVETTTVGGPPQIVITATGG